MGQDVSKELKPNASMFLSNSIHDNKGRVPYQDNKVRVSQQDNKDRVGQDNQNRVAYQIYTPVKRKVQFQEDNTLITPSTHYLTQQPPKPISPLHNSPQTNHFLAQVNNNESKSPLKRSTSPTMKLAERLKRYNSHKEKEIQRLQRQQAERHMQECTFAPKVNTLDTQVHRTSDEFVKQQQDFQERKLKKIEDLRIKKEQEEVEQVRPYEMNRQSRDLIRNINEKEIFSIRIRKQQMIQIRQDQERDIKIKKQRSLSAREREIIQSRLQQQKIVEIPQSFVFQPSNDIDQKHLSQLLQSNILREFNHNCQKLQLNQTISEQDMINIMIQMAFIRNKQDKDTNTQIKQLWQSITLDSKTTNQSRLFQAILIIEGIGITQNNQTQKKYYNLHLNRLQRNQVKPLRSNGSPSKGFSSFQCKTLNNRYQQEIQRAQSKYALVDEDYNDQLAEQYRQKILEEFKKRNENGQQEMNYEEYLNFLQQMTTQRVHEARQDQLWQEKQICTFKPTITKYVSPGRNEKHPTQNVGPMKRTQLLAQNTNPRSTARDKITMEWEKNKHECSFAPQINRTNPVEKRVQVVKYEETVGRMRNARREQENVNKFLERSEQNYVSPNRPSAPIRNTRKSTKIQRSKSEPKVYQENKILIYVDVQIGDIKDTIPIYEKDNLEVVAEIFIIEHNLPISLQYELEQILKQHVSLAQNNEL